MPKMKHENISKRSLYRRAQRSLNDSLAVFDRRPTSTNTESQSDSSNQETINATESSSYRGLTEVDLYSAPGCSHIPLAVDETESETVVDVERDESSSVSSIEDLVLEEHDVSFQETLSIWAIESNITHSAVNKLLIILKSHPCHSNLPSDARTLLQTPRQTLIKDVAPGKYHHFGLEDSIQIALKNIREPYPEEVKLLIGIDGLPIAKSSNSQFWPILCTIVNGLSPSKKIFGPFIVGLYHGNAKPTSLHDFLKDFVDDMNVLSSTGIVIKNCIVRVSLLAIVCDAPAKAFVACTKGHNGYFGCGKCEQEGEYINNRVCFPLTNCKKRTDESFKNREEEEHHTGDSPLESITNFGMVSQFPLDYMHLICLGVMRKLLNLWLRGKVPIRIENRKVAQISEALINLRNHIPKEFARKPRDVKELDRWKATEFRQLLLYTGPVVLLGNIPCDILKNFMTLHSAVTILTSEKYCHSYNEYAHALLCHFVKTFCTLYGEEYVSYNVHNLIHVADDVKLYGPLDAYSAFQFENYLQFIKKLLRKSDRPLQQIARRIQEMQKTSLRPNCNLPGSDFQCSSLHTEGPLIEDCTDPQYKKAISLKFEINLTEADKCCGLKDGSIIFVENIAFSVKKNGMVVIGRKCLDLRDLYTLPCNSSLIEIYLCGHRMTELKQWPICECNKKFVRLPHNNNFAIFPLIHSLDRT